MTFNELIQNIIAVEADLLMYDHKYCRTHRRGIVVERNGGKRGCRQNVR